MLVAGVDIGSIATKAVVLREREIVGRAVTPTGAAPGPASEAVLTAALHEARVAREALQRVIATGYGRRVTPVADGTITEITAAAKGAHLALGDSVRTIVDLGGQDTKVIALDQAGLVRTFAMNDKCAAGTGKFLEVMAHVLGVKLEDLAALSLRAKTPARLSATCTVFAESEVISMIHRGLPPEEIAAALHAAIGGRIAAMVEQVGQKEPIAFIGGGARNPAMRAALERALGVSLRVPQHPQFTVATGAALVARQACRGPQHGAENKSN